MKQILLTRIWAVAETVLCIQHIMFSSWAHGLFFLEINLKAIDLGQWNISRNNMKHFQTQPIKQY